VSRRRKSIIGLGLVVLVAGAGLAYTMVLAPKSESKDRVDGTVYVMPKEFLVNLAGGRYAKLTVALVLAPGQSAGSDAGAAEGFGSLAEEPLIRQIVTDELTGAAPATLISSGGRTRIKRQIRRAVNLTTDVRTTGIVFSDLVVQ
jgi:flagellar FliL protein